MSPGSHPAQHLDFADAPFLAHEFLTAFARRQPDKVALICGGQEYTYREIDEQSDRLARGLAAAGVGRQDRVAILMDNTVETVVSIYGALKAGAIFVLLNPFMKGPRLTYILENSGAGCLISHVSKAAAVAEALAPLARRPTLAWVGPPTAVDGLARADLRWDDLLSAPAAGGALPRVIDRDLAALIYTSGSTGEPKGVMTPHANMVAAARAIMRILENDERDVVFNVLPLSFNYGLYQVLMTFMFGGTVVVERAFMYPHDILRRIEETRPTGFPIVPTIVAMLLRLKDFGRYDLSSVRYLTNTGAALPAAHIRALRERLPEARIFSMFGLTECKRVLYLPPELVDTMPDSVGVAMPNCEAWLVDEEGREAAPGVVGEMVVRGSNVMRGYWGDPALSARMFRPGERPGETLLWTGDLFRRDERGFFYFVGRRGDIIKSRGERVSSLEVENTLCEVDGVAEAAVIGVPDEILGHAIAAFVAVEPGAKITARQLAHHCADRLLPFMVPKHLFLLDALPKTPNGKTDKRALAARHAAGDFATAGQNTAAGPDAESTAAVAQS